MIEVPASALDLGGQTGEHVPAGPVEALDLEAELVLGDELQLLPGVGAKRAGAIVSTRKNKGGFKSVDEQKLKAYIPILGDIPIVGNLFRRKARVKETRSLVILISARIVDLRAAESRSFNEAD